MIRRRLLPLAAAACLLLLLAVPFVVRWAMPPEPGLTEANFKRLHTGMTVEQVRAILGPETQVEVFNPEVREYIWMRGTEGALVEFEPGHPERGAVGGHFGRTGEEDVLSLAEPPPQNLVARVRRWFGL